MNQTNVIYKTLSNGVKIPVIGIGTDRVANGSDVINEIYWAIKSGYRNIDTAFIYHNEGGVGLGIKKAIDEGLVKREDLFVTTKVHKIRRGYNATLEVFNESLQKLQLDYIDLYLIHSPHRESVEWKDEVIDTWRAMEKLYNEGKIRALGVSNFGILHLEYLLAVAEIKPVINQIELHPQHQQKDVVAYCQKNNIMLSAWSALNQGRVFNEQLLQEMALKYNKSISQICLRWNIQKGFIPLTRSIKREHIENNIQIFDFEISDVDMKMIDTLNGGSFSGMHYDEQWGGIVPKSFLHDLYLEYYLPFLKGYNPKTYCQIFRLFGFLPVFKINKYNYNKTKYLLFGIPIFIKKTKSLSDSKELTFLQKIFSITNCVRNDKKYKIVTILGIEISFKSR